MIGADWAPLCRQLGELQLEGACLLPPDALRGASRLRRCELQGAHEFQYYGEGEGAGAEELAHWAEVLRCLPLSCVSLGFRCCANSE